MDPVTKEKFLKIALRISGIAFCLIYPLSMVWPSGWLWHGGEGAYIFQMLVSVYAVLGVFLVVAANNPREHRSLIWFAVWSSVAHGLLMVVQALGDQNEHGHLFGDIPAILLVAAVLGYLMPPKDN